MGNYDDVKDAVSFLPAKKAQGYLYLIICSNFLMKVGRSANIASRLKTHEHGLKCYGFNRINFVVISNPTLSDIDLEKALIDKFFKELKAKRMGREWFRTSDTRKAIRIFLETIDGAEFVKVETRRNVCDVFASHIEKYFAAVPDCQKAEFLIDDLANHFVKAQGVLFPSYGRAKTVLTAIAHNNPSFITLSGKTMTINRTALLSDLFYRPDNFDHNIYKKLGDESEGEEWNGFELPEGTEEKPESAAKWKWTD